MDKSFVVRWQATMMGSEAIAHLGATEVFADDEKQLLLLRLTWLRRTLMLAQLARPLR